jgi:3-methyladenine DNA glycosylase AlkD
VSARLKEAMDLLERAGDRRTIDGYARYSIVARRPLGVPMNRIQALAKTLGTDHALAAALFKTGVYEAQLLSAFVADPLKLTRAQMDAWTRDFDNWGVCDTLCFKLYDRSPHAWSRVAAWAAKKDEFVKRSAFALLASLALHDKAAKDAAFVKALPLCEKAATDDRNFVKKGVSWALRSIGRRNPDLRARTVALATRLAASDDASARWIGKDTLKDLARKK